MFETIYAQVWAAATLLTCSFALWKGERLEQVAAGAILIAWISTVFVQQDTGTVTPKYFWLGIDAAMLALLALLAKKSMRSWPLFAAAFQSVAVAVHIMSLLDLKIGTSAYLTAVTISGYGVLACLTIGTWRIWREREALSFTQ